MRFHKELVLANLLQSQIGESGVAHHFKITNTLIILNFRNTPIKNTQTFLKLSGFEKVQGHRDRKYIYHCSTGSANK